MTYKKKEKVCKYFNKDAKNHFNNIKNDFNFKKNIRCSFEFFPPKNEKMKKIFWNSIKELSYMNPNFFSITCSANNTSKNFTYGIVKSIIKKVNIAIMPHVTCSYFNQNEVKNIAEKYWSLGIRHILALRGDGGIGFSHKENFYASDLVKLLKSVKNFDISVAAYPETHPEAKNDKIDLENLKKKIDCGANRAITQFFFDVDVFLRFRDKCQKIGIKKQIIPGILPILNFNQLQNFISMTNVTVPVWVLNMLNNKSENSKIIQTIGCSIVIDMLRKLYKEGIRNFHFYTLNRFESCYSILQYLKNYF